MISTIKNGWSDLIILIIPYLCLARGQESTNDKQVCPKMAT